MEPDQSKPGLVELGVGSKFNQVDALYTTCVHQANLSEQAVLDAEQAFLYLERAAGMHGNLSYVHLRAANF